MKRSDSILANFYNQELSRLPAFRNGGKKKKTPPVKKETKQKIQYIDLDDVYNLDPFSKEGMEKARELTKLNPNTRIVCDASGCSEIAVNAAEGYGYDYNRGHAWDLGNTNTVVATNPIYNNLVGKGILPDPKNYSAPGSMFVPGSIIGLNRMNNLVGGKANSRDEADDSWDYANQKLYPKSRGYEHVGFMLDDKTMLHGTGAGKGHPAFYTIDANLSDGVQLGDIATYQAVETIQQTPLQKKAENQTYTTNPIKRLIRLFGFKNGGMITDPRGQWKYPGMNTRIPGSNITMQGVPYPVLAQANNGMTTMMQPGQDYYFPGADYVDEYPMMSGGGLVKYQKKGEVTLPPIYVDNPNDPRLRAYGDSTRANKSTEPLLNALKEYNKNPTDKTKKAYFKAQKDNYDPNSYNREGWIYEHSIKPSKTSLTSQSGPDGNPDWYFTYPEAVQPVIYQPGLKKMVSKMEPISTQSSYTPSLRMLNIPNIEVPSVQSGNYMVGYIDENNQGVDRGFVTPEQRDAFVKELQQRNLSSVQPYRGNITEYYRIPKKLNGGLVKYQRQGEVRSPINLRLPSYQAPKSFVTGYGFSENPVPNVNIYGVGAYGEGNINNKLNLSGNVSSASVFYPGGNKIFMKPNFNVGMKYRFDKGGDISIPNLRQAYYPMAYGGPMVRYMAGKMTGPNIF